MANVNERECTDNTYTLTEEIVLGWLCIMLMKNLVGFFWLVFFSGKWAIQCHNFRGWKMSMSLSESWSFPASTNHKPAPAACLLPRGSADAPEQPLKWDLRWRWQARARPRASVPSSLLLDDFGLSHHIHRDASVFLPLYLSTYVAVPVFCTPWWFLSLSYSPVVCICDSFTSTSEDSCYVIILARLFEVATQT